MALPPLAPYPPVGIRKEALREEWEAYLDAWIALAQAHLRLSSSEFSSVSHSDSSLVKFVISYLQETSRDITKGLDTQDTKAKALRRHSFLLAHKLLSSHVVPQVMLGWRLLADLCHVFPRSQSLEELLRALWKRESRKIEEGVQEYKGYLTRSLDSPTTSAHMNGYDDLFHSINSLAPSLHVSSEAAASFMTGSDFLDALTAAYGKADARLRPKLVAVAYFGLTSLIKGERPNYSMLSDHLYSLKGNAEGLQEENQPSLLSDLVTNTPILTRIRANASGQSAGRLTNLAASLSTFHRPDQARSRKLVRRKPDKGKAPASDEYGRGAFGGVHVHRMSLITQMQDLFSDLGSGFVVKLLDEYHDDVEQVTAHLLDDSLPPHLKAADRSEQMYVPLRIDVWIDYLLNFRPLTAATAPISKITRTSPTTSPHAQPHCHTAAMSSTTMHSTASRSLLHACTLAVKMQP